MSGRPGRAAIARYLTVTNMKLTISFVVVVGCNSGLVVEKR
jgi:hypothetical protein